MYLVHTKRLYQTVHSMLFWNKQKESILFLAWINTTFHRNSSRDAHQSILKRCLTFNICVIFLKCLLIPTKWDLKIPPQYPTNGSLDLEKKLFYYILFILQRKPQSITNFTKLISNKLKIIEKKIFISSWNTCKQKIPPPGCSRHMKNCLCLCF